MKTSTFFDLLTGSAHFSSLTFPLHRRQPSNLSPLISRANGDRYQVEVQVNNQTLYLIPDTGSTKLWVPVADFECVELDTGYDVPQEECHFADTYQVPDNAEYVTNETFGVQYVSGAARGKVGYADITLNGITIENQRIGLVDRTNDFGDGIGSGILGLAFPSVTPAHPGTKHDNSKQLLSRASHDPVLVGMHKQGLVAPWYSFSFERPLQDATTGPDGWFGLGELPPVAHSDDWAVAPIEATEGFRDGVRVRVITMMTLSVEGITWGSGSSPNSCTTTNLTSFQAVVDTGSPLNLVPAAIAEAVSNAFSPPGVFDAESQVYMVDCNATTPEFGVILDGQTFWHQSPEDLIVRDPGDLCYSSIVPSDGIGFNILGLVFMRNVVSVFDFGKEEMRFAARVVDTSTPVPTHIPDSVAAGISHCLYVAVWLAVALWCI